MTSVPEKSALKSSKVLGLASGVLLGLGAPLGSLFLGMVFFGKGDPRWIASDFSEHFYYYVYMGLLTPLVFGVFGFHLGRLNDQLRSQKALLENLTVVLETQSITDEITALYNHRHLSEELEKEIERSKRHGHTISGMMIDIDSFKKVNDTHGHLAGDCILREMAFVLKNSIRKIDVIARYGGDEFVIILPETGPDAAMVVSERVMRNVRQHHFNPKKEPLPLTVSIGLFSFEDTSSLDRDRFIEKIDEAMFLAKSMGKNTVFAVS